MDTLYFNNSKGQKICGILSNPGSKHVILMCHGLGSNKESPRYLLLENRLNKLGLATFRIDFLGHGDSEGNYEDLTLTEATDNVLKAREKLSSLGFKRIGFIGTSFGGVAGIMAAEKYEFSYMVLVSPPTHYDIKEIFMSGMHVIKEWRRFNKRKKVEKKKEAGMKIAFFKDYGSQDSYVAASKIKCPVIIIHGDADKLVPVGKSKELRKKIKDSKIKILKGVDHHYTHPLATLKLIDIIMDFIKEKK